MSYQITEYLTHTRTVVVFICPKCGDTIKMNVPTQPEESIKSYCCSARFMVKTYKDHTFNIFRLEDNTEDTKDAEVRVDSIPR